MDTTSLKDGSDEVDVATLRPEESVSKAIASPLGESDVEQIFNNISQFMIHLDEDGTVAHWTSAAERVLHFKTEDAMGKPLGRCAVPWDWKVVEEGILECRRTNERVRLEDVPFKCPDGQERFLSVTVIPLIKEDGSTGSVVLIGYDITQRKILEISIAETNKLESLGQITTSIAYEIDSPIQYIGDNIRFLGDAFNSLTGLIKKYQSLTSAIKAGSVTKSQFQEVNDALEESDWEYLSDEIPNALTQTEQGVQQVSKSVNAIHDFARPGSDDRLTIDLNRALESTIVVTRNDWKYVAELVTDLEPDLPPVPCHRAQINQVFMHLIKNASEAIAEKVKEGSGERGTIKLSTRSEKKWVEIWLSDSGNGIPEEIQSKVFNPFFTTKAKGDGIGQGLAICRTVIEDKHGGKIRFETVPGNGTIFIIQLPLEA
ncbi:MAG: two-component system sensor histidine kinase NtrB [Planctomycetota bacterium]